jgi:hypothetical protein
MGPWMVVAEHWTTSLSNGSGGVSNMRIFIEKVPLPRQNYSADKKKYFIEFNVERSHQSLGYNSTPGKVCRAAVGGGARIVDKYSKKNKPTEELKVKEGQRLSAA